MGFGADHPTRKGTEVRPDQMPLPPVVHVYFEPQPTGTAGLGRVYVHENADLRVELYIDEVIEALPNYVRDQLDKEVRLAAVEKFKGRFQQWAVGQRDNMDRPGIGEIHHKRYTDDDVTMDYYTQRNTSRVDMTVRGKALDELQGDILIKKLEALCMFIFYDSNKIIAVRMTCFETGQFSRLARVTQKTRGWGSKLCQATQMCFDGRHAVILGEIGRGIESKVFYKKDTYFFGVGVVDKRDMQNAGKHWMTSGLSLEEDLPVVNGAGLQLYTTVSSGSLDPREKRVTMSLNDFANLPIKRKAYGVAPTGKMLYALLSETGYMHINVMLTPVSPTGDRAYYHGSESQEDEYKRKVDEALPTAGDTGGAYVLTQGHSAFGDDFQIDYTVAASDVAIKPDMTIRGVRVVHTQDGGTDRLEYREEPIKVRVEWVEGGDYYDSQDFRYRNFQRFYISTRDEGATLHQFMWPPATFGSDAVLVGEEGATVSTFYGDFSSFKPWLHVSDGKHTIQAVVGDDVRYLFLDGRDFSSTLADLTGRSLEDIQCVYLGLPVSLIIRK